jgi:hypothetical protein
MLYLSVLIFQLLKNKSMKTHLLTLIFALATTLLSAQRASSIFLELGGNGVFYSVNCDTRFADTPNGLGMKIGGAVMYGDDAGYFVPASLNYLIGKRKNFLEIGGGGVGIFYKDTSTPAGGTTTRVFPTATLVYRYQPIDNGFLFRIGLAPVFAPQENNSYFSAKIFWLLPGVSFGYKF